MSLLSLGASGPDVELLQAVLERAGFSPGDIDGIFGENTRRALIAFQENNGIITDGTTDDATWHALSPFLSGYILHTIQPGDTFYLLAQRYNTGVYSIETANPEHDPYNLRIGARLVIPLSFPAVFTNISFTSRVMALCADGLKARYPFLNIGSAGQSVLSKPLFTFSVGSGPRQVFINGAHHANEWITTPVIMKFLEDYCSAIASESHIWGRGAIEIFENTTLFMIPMVNPDGVDLVTGYYPPGSEIYESALSMNDQSPNFPSNWKANIKGVDLNLQYPAGWEEARSIKFDLGYTQPGPANFVGDAPLDQPESAAVYEYTLEHNFNITLSYHTQGQVIYWKYLNFNPPGAFKLGQQFAYVSGYALEQTPYESGFAGYKDWFILSHNRPGYTVEAGLGVNPLPVSQLEEIYDDNLGIFVLALNPNSYI